MVLSLAFVLAQARMFLFFFHGFWDNQLMRGRLYRYRFTGAREQGIKACTIMKIWIQKVLRLRPGWMDATAHL